MSQTDNKQLLRSAEEFYGCCQTDVKLIQSCAECFLNELADETDHWFVETCSKPHLIVMVKLHGYRYSYVPAKILRFDKENVFVRLFEELNVADVPYKDCLLYAKQMPSTTKALRKSLKAFTVSTVLMSLFAFETTLDYSIFLT